MAAQNVDPNIKHLFEEPEFNNVYDLSKNIDLASGCPGPDMLHSLPDIIAQATAHRMEEEKKNGSYLFQYGPTTGLWSAREALAKFLTKNYKSQVKRENLVLTCGATHGLHLVLTTLLASDAVIFVEEYTYMTALQLLKEFPQHRIIPVPMNSNGVNTEELLKIVSLARKQHKYNTSEDKPFWGLFYTTPIFQNPTGTTLPAEKCQAVLNIAREQDLLVFCDDVYYMLYYGNESSYPKRMFEYDQKDDPDYKGGHVISNSTFSKILAPGLRVGWMEVPLKFTDRFRQSGIFQSGGSVNNFMFGIIQSVIELGLADKQLIWYKQLYKERMSVLCNTLEEHLPKGCSFHRSEGGYFVWLWIPVDGEEFLDWSIKRGGPRALPAINFRVPTSEQTKNYSPAIRLCIGFHTAENLKTAAVDLCKKLKEYIVEKKI